MGSNIASSIFSRSWSVNDPNNANSSTPTLLRIADALDEGSALVLSKLVLEVLL